MPDIERPLTAPFVSLNNATGTGIITGSVVDFGQIDSGFAVLVEATNPGSGATIALEVSWDGTLFQGVANDSAVNAQYTVDFPARYVRVDCYNLATGGSITAQVVPL